MVKRVSRRNGRNNRSSRKSRRNIRKNRSLRRRFNGGYLNPGPSPAPGPVPAPGPGPVPAPVPDSLAAVRAAIAALNAAIGCNDALRAIVKRRLQILYGTSETWKKLRSGANAAAFNNANSYNAISQNIKDLIDELCDAILAVFNGPLHADLDYGRIVTALMRNNLYRVSEQEFYAEMNENDNNNNNNNNNNVSIGWSENNNYNNNNNNSNSNSNVAGPEGGPSNGDNGDNEENENSNDPTM